MLNSNSQFLFRHPLHLPAVFLHQSSAAGSKLDVSWYRSHNCQDAINPVGIYADRQDSGFHRAAGPGVIGLTEEEKEIERLLLGREDLYSGEEYFWGLISSKIVGEGSSEQQG